MKIFSKKTKTLLEINEILHNISVPVLKEEQRLIRDAPNNRKKNLRCH